MERPKCPDGARFHHPSIQCRRLANPATILRQSVPNPVPIRCQSVSNLKANPVPIGCQSDNRSNFSQTSKSFSNPLPIPEHSANPMPIWCQSDVNQGPIHCQSDADPVPILFQFTISMQIYQSNANPLPIHSNLPIHHQSFYRTPIGTNLPIHQQTAHPMPILDQSSNLKTIPDQFTNSMPILCLSRANLPIHQSSATRRQVTQFNASSTHHQSTNLSPIYDQPTRSINPPSRIIHPTVKTDDTQVIPTGTRSATVVPIPDQSESQTHTYQR